MGLQENNVDVTPGIFRVLGGAGTEQERFVIAVFSGTQPVLFWGFFGNTITDLLRFTFYAGVWVSLRVKGTDVAQNFRKMATYRYRGYLRTITQ